MRDRQISVRRVAYELGIPKTTIHEIMNNHMDMKKICTRWVPKLLTPIQRTRILLFDLQRYVLYLVLIYFGNFRS